MEKVTIILNRKESHFNYISPACSLDEALCRMNCEGTDHLVVIDEDGRFNGVITEHDIASKAVLEKTFTYKKYGTQTGKQEPAYRFYRRHSGAVPATNATTPGKIVTRIRRFPF